MARSGLTTLALVAAAAAPAGAHGPTFHAVSQAGDATPRFVTDRPNALVLPLPEEEDAFVFAIFGDRTGGPPEGIAVLEQAVADVNLVEPDLVMTVGDLVQGYNETPEWMEQMREFRGVMERLLCPWFPVAGNHDVYWRGPEGERPEGEHEASYEAHFGPLWYAFRHKNAWFVALYTDEGDPETGRKDFEDPAAQRMSPEQLAWLEETLGRARDADHVFVFLHHPRWQGGQYGDDWERVHRVLAAAGNVTAVFAGHIHQMVYDGERDGIEYFALATVGGVAVGDVERAGYLHQFHLVTVRPDHVAVAAFPVGAALDPRAITARVAREARAVSRGLTPRFLERAPLAADGSVEGRVELELANPVASPLEVTLVPESADSRWRVSPDHVHLRLEPGAAETVSLEIRRHASALDETFRVPELVLDTDYLTESLRIPVPEKRWSLPLDLAALPAPPRSEDERVLALAGDPAGASVGSASIDLPDGPLTLEGWLRADEFRAREGFLAKTEGSEYGIFVSGGKPAFSVHLDGAYAEAASELALAPGAWHHVAGVFDGSQVRLYVDGRRVAARAASGTRTRNALPLMIGADVDGAGSATSPFVGELDEVRLSATARYAGESFEPLRRFEPDEATRLLLHADGPVGPWLFDASGRGAHAELLSGVVRSARP